MKNRHLSGIRVFLTGMMLVLGLGAFTTAWGQGDPASPTLEAPTTTLFPTETSSPTETMTPTPEPSVTPSSTPSCTPTVLPTMEPEYTPTAEVVEATPSPTPSLSPVAVITSLPTAMVSTPAMIPTATYTAAWQSLATPMVIPQFSSPMTFPALALLEQVCATFDLLPGKVIGQDVLAQMVPLLRTETGEPGFNPAFDFNSDERINILDLQGVASLFGQACGE